MYLESAKAYFGVWLADDWPSFRQIVTGKMRSLIPVGLMALGRRTNLGEIEPAPLEESASTTSGLSLTLSE